MAITNRELTLKPILKLKLIRLIAPTFVFLASLLITGPSSAGVFPSSRGTSVRVTSERLQLAALGAENICGTPLDASGESSIRCIFPDRMNKSSVRIGSTKAVFATSMGNCVLDEDGMKCWGDDLTPTMTDRLKVITAGAPRELFSGGSSICRADARLGVVTCPMDIHWPNSGGLVLPDQNQNEGVRFGPFADLRAVAISEYHFCALDGNRLRCQGTANANPLATPQAELDHPRAVAIGQNHACTLVATGVRCFGENGELAISTPGLNPTLLNANSLVAGLKHECAITSREGVVCFQVEDPAIPTAAANVPAELQADGAGVIQLVAGTAYSCALLRSGQVKCWGEAGETVLEVPNFYRHVISLAGGPSHVCATLEGGNIRCWGDNIGSLLDVPARKNEKLRVSIVGSTTCFWTEHNVICSSPFQPFKFIDQNNLQDFAMSGWGSAGACAIDQGQDHINRLTCAGGEFMTVPSEIFNPTLVAMSTHSACAVHENKLTCWGSEKLPKIPANIADVRKIQLSEKHGCLLDQYGLACWGAEDSLAAKVPARLRDFDAVTDFAVGHSHTCAITLDRKVACWGQNTYGQLDVPELVEPVSIFAANYFTCATDAEGIKCWGETPPKYASLTEQSR